MDGPIARIKDFSNSRRDIVYKQHEECHLVPVYYVTNRKKTGHKSLRKYYAPEWDYEMPIKYGKCLISIPKKHKIGEVERPKWWKCEFKESQDKHLVIREIIQINDAQEYFSDMACKINKSTSKDAFIFIHGFNETFEKTALRTGQMAFDLKFEGAPIFYSWPSVGNSTAYETDSDQVSRDTIIDLFVEFIANVVEDTKCEKLHLIAHSMGNRILSRALSRLRQHENYEAIKSVINQIILTAADIDAEIFKNEIAPQIIGSSHRLTLYVSENDKALWASRKVHSDKPRVGEKVLVFQGIDTIDASKIKTSLMGHGYFSNTKELIDDIHFLFENNYPPDHAKRKLIKVKDVLALPYWAFE